MKPCPFCGSEELKIQGQTVLWVECEKCKANGPLYQMPVMQQYALAKALVIELWDERVKENKSPLNNQIGGDHYSKLKIQPAQYIHANGIGFIEGSVIKYVSRWRDKGGIQDLEKAKHFIDLLIELEKDNG